MPLPTLAGWLATGQTSLSSVHDVLTPDQRRRATAQLLYEAACQAGVQQRAAGEPLEQSPARAQTDPALRVAQPA